jgi:hypothetical protein
VIYDSCIVDDPDWVAENANTHRGPLYTPETRKRTMSWPDSESPALDVPETPQSPDSPTPSKARRTDEGHRSFRGLGRTCSSFDGTPETPSPTKIWSNSAKSSRSGTESRKMDDAYRSAIGRPVASNFTSVRISPPNFGLNTEPLSSSDHGVANQDISTAPALAKRSLQKAKTLPQLPIADFCAPTPTKLAPMNSADAARIVTDSRARASSSTDTYAQANSSAVSSSRPPAPCPLQRAATISILECMSILASFSMIHRIIMISPRSP